MAEIRYFASPATPAGLAAAMRAIRDQAIAELLKADGFRPAPMTMELFRQVEGSAINIGLEYEEFRPQATWTTLETEAVAAIFATGQVLIELQGKTKATHGLGSLPAASLRRLMHNQARAFYAAPVLGMEVGRLFRGNLAATAARERAQKTRAAHMEQWRWPLWAFSEKCLAQRNATNADLIARFKETRQFTGAVQKHFPGIDRAGRFLTNQRKATGLAPSPRRPGRR